MNRRDLLKQAGTFLAASALPANALVDNDSDKSRQDLLVTLTGPFCYWKEQDHMRVMAPRIVGAQFCCFPHTPWLATTANEAVIPWDKTSSNNTFHYQLTGVSSRPMAPHGTTLCSFPQDACTPPPPEDCSGCNSTTRTTKKSPAKPRSSPSEEYHCCPALFDILLPYPDQLIGINPTCVKFDPPRTDGPNYASAINCFYRNTKNHPIDFKNIKFESVLSVPPPPPPPPFVFVPDFSNDKGLPSASLRINLTPLSVLDPQHNHAREVFFQMLTMFPWVEINSVEFCSGLPVEDPCQQAGPGTDCQAPLFLLDPGLPLKKK